MGRCTKNNHDGPSADATIARDRCADAVGTESKPAKPTVGGINIGQRRTEKRKRTIRSHVTRIAVRTYVAAALIAVASNAATAQPQSYPARPIRIVVPAAPGRPTDAVARLASQFISKLGQPVVVENRGGAGGALGAREVAGAAPDGYTLLAGNTSTLAVIPATSANAGYDPSKDFVPVALVLGELSAARGASLTTLDVAEGAGGRGQGQSRQARLRAHRQRRNAISFR
jgi:hypothetical protein